ncbi:MAG: ATP-binding protein [Bacteroidota bacterium]
MRNIVGQTPRGTDFFKRSAIIKKIYRRLEAGNHIFLSAPRRAGKTSIMRFLEDNPQEGYAFIYINTEDVDDLEDFFRLLSEELLDSEAAKKMTQLVESSKGLFAAFTEKITKIKLWDLEVQLKQGEPSTYKDEFQDLLKKLNTRKFTIVIMLDEFPVTLEKIHKKHGEYQAVHFLHCNRALRQEANQGIQFIYTGSIGLASIASKLNATAALNDLNVLEIPPLSTAEARRFTARLLKAYNVKFEDGSIDYLLSKLQWLMPFFIQLVVQVLIDEYETRRKTIDQKFIDQAIEKSSTHRNHLYFVNYYTRLEKSLPPEEAKVAKKILLEIANKTEVPLDAFEEHPHSRRILEMLILDGYINNNQNAYRFNSPILRDWWKKYGKD